MSRIQTLNGRLALDLPSFNFFLYSTQRFPIHVYPGPSGPRLLLLRRGIPSASFYGDPAGRWKTPASNENLLLGVAWDSIVFWYAILARGEKMEVLFSCYKNSSHWLPARLQGLKKKWESPRGSSRIQCCSMVFKKCRPSNHTATPAPEFLTCGCSEALASVTSPLAGVWFRSIPRIQRSGMNIYNHMI